MNKKNFEDFSAGDWHDWLLDNPEKVVMFVDVDDKIHSFEVDEGEVMFVSGGTYGYDGDGTMAALEQFAKETSNAFKVVDADDEIMERGKLAGGHYENPTEWIEDV